MKKVLFSLALLTLLFGFSTGVSASTEPQINIPVKTVIRGDVGSTHVLAEESIAEDLIGMTCSVNATAKNQGSVHPGNDLVIASGEQSVTLENVEREANGLTEAEGSLQLGNTLTVTLVLGKDKVFSGGMTVNLHCEEPPREIEVCRDGKVITINEDERKDTDTEAPCPTPEEPKEPEVLPAVTELPKTGAGSLATGAIIATGVLGTVAHATVTRRKLQ